MWLPYLEQIYQHPISMQPLIQINLVNEGHVNVATIFRTKIPAPYRDLTLNVRGPN